MKSKREIGNIGENEVCKQLTQQGYLILKRNYTIRGGEIDIIAIKESILIFVEVKTRKQNSMVSGIEAVDTKKQQHIIKTALDYCMHNDIDYTQMRFDVAEVILLNNIVKRINYIDNAFDATDCRFIF